MGRLLSNFVCLVALHSARGFTLPLGRTLCPLGSVAAPSIENTTPVSKGSDEFNDFAKFLLSIQDEICRAAEQADGSGAEFCVDRWERENGGGLGLTRVLEGGDVLEKAAASVSIIHGTLNRERAKSMSERGRGSINPDGGGSYSAAALSLVFHSRSPLVPTFRADVRLFEIAGQRWYGGGADLTPYYLPDADIIEFHKRYRDICRTHGTEDDYTKMKEFCDQYFYIPLRNEHRGVGGIFFDDLESFGPGGAEGAGQFVRDVAKAFMPSYLPMAQRLGAKPYTKEQRDWQLYRRGRYLEFNLLYDRGVRFGLTGGRAESIMVSAPPLIAWGYKKGAAPVSPNSEIGREEARLLEVLKKPLDWANL